MPSDQLRSRTVGCKMTEAECEPLTALAEQEGLTLYMAVSSFAGILLVEIVQFRLDA